MKPVKCPYCGQPAKFTNGAALFPGRSEVHVLSMELARGKKRKPEQRP